MSEFYLTQTTEYRVKELSLVLSNGERFDISSIFEEINLFDNIFMPCFSANIMIIDSINLFEKLRLNGDEKVFVHLDKTENGPNSFEYKKEFTIYTITNRTSITPTSQVYTLNLANPDFLYSLQKRVNQTYKGTYSEIVSKILVDHLRVPKAVASGGKSGFGSIFPTNRVQELIIPSMTPFEAIRLLTKRSTSKNNLPDYVFYESPVGYNFAPISELMTYDPSFEINFNPKNVEGNISKEFLGAREFKVLSSFNLFDTIKDGSYAGKFVGFDTLTRTQSITLVKNAYSQSPTHANPNPNLTNVINKENKSPFEMVNSRIVTYPFSVPRSQVAFIRENNPGSLSVLDNTHEYVFQRKALFSNLMQKRMQVALPGNFALFSGSLVQLNVPRFGIKEENASNKDAIDTTLSGKYIILGTRHIIKQNKHETLIEVATDSNMA